MDGPLIKIAAAQNKEIADFLYWSRFPFATLQATGDGIEVVIGDARYGRAPDDGHFSVREIISNTPVRRRKE
jgi:inner membrane protein